MGTSRARPCLDQMGTFEDWTGVVLRITLTASVFAFRTCLYLAYIVPLCTLYIVIILTTSVVIHIIFVLILFSVVAFICILLICVFLFICADVYILY